MFSGPTTLACVSTWGGNAKIGGKCPRDGETFFCFGFLKQNHFFIYFVRSPAPVLFKTNKIKRYVIFSDKSQF